jgi:hypothetical protein
MGVPEGGYGRLLADEPVTGDRGDRCGEQLGKPIRTGRFTA